MIRKHMKVFSIHTVVMVVALSFLLASCSDDSKAPGTGETETPIPDAEENINGITLGTHKDQVVELWGSQYVEEDYIGDSGYEKEEAYLWTYGNDAHLLIGRTSQEVISIRVYSNELETAMGVKVGDYAEESFELYRRQYTEAVSRHGDYILEGIFDVGNDMILVFDTNKGDGKLVNEDITSESTIEAIYLLYWDSVD